MLVILHKHRAFFLKTSYKNRFPELLAKSLTEQSAMVILDEVAGTDHLIREIFEYIINGNGDPNHKMDQFLVFEMCKHSSFLDRCSRQRFSGTDQFDNELDVMGRQRLVPILYTTMFEEL